MLPEQITTIDKDAGARLTGADTASIAVAGVDLAALNTFSEAQLPGEPDLIVELIDLYLKDTAQRLNDLNQAAAKADATLLKHAAHTLKGSSANLGVLHIVEICKKLEEANLIDSPHRVEVLIQLLHYKFAKVSAVFAAVRQSRLE